MQCHAIVLGTIKHNIHTPADKLNERTTNDTTKYTKKENIKTSKNERRQNKIKEREEITAEREAN